jgi:hypothetical protein
LVDDDQEAALCQAVRGAVEQRSEIVVFAWRFAQTTPGSRSFSFKRAKTSS